MWNAINRFFYLSIGSGSSFNNLPGGGAEDNTNIFDNHNIGIDIEKSNVVVNNATFQKPNPIGNIINTDAIGIRVRNNHRNYITLNTPAGCRNNAFFDMNTAISAEGDGGIKIDQCDILSNQYISNISYMGSFGIKVSSGNYHAVNISNNRIYNIQTGIWFSGGGTSSSGQGGIIVNNNKIAAQIPGNPNLDAWLNNAIDLETFIFGGTNNKLVTCNANEITNAAKGIKLSGWPGATINNNTVGITNYPLAPTDDEQYGIYLEGGFGNAHTSPNTIEGNTVSGPGMSIPSTGILLSQQSTTSIGCNHVGQDAQGNYGGFTHGFRFAGTNPNTKFWDNTMYTSNQYGMTLWEDGVIDKQGNEDIAAGPVCTRNNSWENSSSYWQSLSGQYMTYCQNSDATKSPLVIRNSTNHPEINPDGSGYSTIPGVAGFKYSVADGTLILTNSPDGVCNRCADPVSVSRIKTLLQEIADGTVSLPADDANDRLLVMQQQLYDLIKANPDLALNDTTLQQFIYDNQWSNLDFIYYAARYVAEARWDLVQILLGAWPGQANLDEAYRHYFEWLKNMHDIKEWQPNFDEVWELANKCPLKYGTVIYSVRNLYNALTGRIHDFADNCEGNEAGRNTTKQQGFIRLKQPKGKNNKPVGILEKNKLVVYPNPTTGIVNIEYNKMTLVTIIDAAGRTVMSKKLNNNNATQLNVSSLPKGFYIIRVTGADNTTQSQKLINNRQ